MRNNKLHISQLSFLALTAVLNIAGANLALTLRLPIYFDTLGTMMAAMLFGPVYGMIPGLISALITGITTDIYSLFFLPVQLITGFAAGLLLHTKDRTIHSGRFPLPVLTLLISVPGTVVSALISSFVFGGITSSGSSVLVQILHHSGLGLTESVFCVQIFTDYADRILTLFVSIFLLHALPKSIIQSLKEGVSYGSIQ